MTQEFITYLAIAFILAVTALGRWDLDLNGYSLEMELAEMSKAGTTYARSLCGQGIALSSPATAAQLKTMSFTDIALTPDGVRSEKTGFAWSYVNADRGRIVLRAQTDNEKYRTRLRMLVPASSELTGGIVELTVPAVSIGSQERLRTYMRSEVEFECEV